MEQDLERAADMLVRRLKKLGQPSGRNEWKVVLVCLMKLSRPQLEAFGRAARMGGLSWIVPAVEGMIAEEQAGRATRDENGFLILRAQPKDAGLIALLD